MYGGTTSIMIGSYSWSADDSGQSDANSGDTYCSGCAVNVSDVAITNSIAVSNTPGKLRAAFRLLQLLCSDNDCVCALR